MSKQRIKAKQHAKIRRMNWDVQACIDLQCGDGFLVTDPAEFVMDDTKQKSMNGPQSPRFGTSYEDEHGFMERYRCNCGEFKGLYFRGETCPYCGSKVEAKGIDFNQTGWIPLRGYKIINPAYYRILASVIGSQAFTDMIISKQKVDRDGNRSLLTDEDADIIKPTSNYMGIGLIEFYRQYDTILEEYRDKKKNKSDVIDMLLEEKGAVFTSYIPIYTTMLRPQSITSESFYHTGIDKQINPIISLANNLEDCEPIDLDIILNHIQKRVNTMWEFNFELLNDKDGIIRDQLLGGSINYSSRNVIVPDPTLRTDQIDLSYAAAYKLFKLQIIYYLKKLNHISLAEANEIWESAYTFNEQVYQIMNFIVEKKKPMILINRNPTINYYSLVLMRIRKVKRDPNDYTLSIPLGVLAGLNADQQIEVGICSNVYLEIRERLTSGVIYLMSILLTVEVRYRNKLRKRIYGPETWIADNTVLSLLVS